jgi:hypothetical protein
MGDKYPKPFDLVIADQPSGLSGGRVRVHAYGDRYLTSVVTRCGTERRLRDRDWHWLAFQTLNPEKVLFCKRGCWKEGSD